MWFFLPVFFTGSLCVFVISGVYLVYWFLFMYSLYCVVPCGVVPYKGSLMYSVSPPWVFFVCVLGFLYLDDEYVLCAYSVWFSRVLGFLGVYLVPYGFLA